MSLLAVALLVVGGAITAGAVARRRRRASARPAPVASPALPGFPVAPGSVISVGGEEAWLEKGWLLEEGDTPLVAVLFAENVVVIALPEPASTLYWLSSLPSPPVSGEPPTTLAVEEERFERARRVPVSVRSLSAATKPPFSTALLSEYRTAGGGALWLLSHENQALCWCGRRVEDSELTNFGVGASVMDD